MYINTCLRGYNYYTYITLILLKISLIRSAVDYSYLKKYISYHFTTQNPL